MNTDWFCRGRRRCDRWIQRRKTWGKSKNLTTDPRQGGAGGTGSADEL